MKALVKQKPEPGLWLSDDADPRDRSRRRSGQGPQDRHLRHRRPHFQLGRVGAEDDPDADDDRPRICGRDRRRRGERAPARSRTARVGRGPRDRHAEPGGARRALSSRPGDARHRGQHPRRLRRIRARSRLQHRAPARRRRRRARRDPRSARQRGPHRAVLRPRRRGRADHRGGADRHHGRRGRPPCRGAARRDHRRQSEAA